MPKRVWQYANANKRNSWERARICRAKPAYVAEVLENLVTLDRTRKQGGKFSR